MGKKDRHFSKSQAWLDWLSDDKAHPQQNLPSSTTSNPSAVSPRGVGRPSVSSRRQYTPRPLSRPKTSPLSHSLGLDPSVFRSTASRVQQGAQIKAKPRSEAPKPDDTITLNLQLPSFTFRRFHVNWRKVGVYSVIAVVIAGLVFGTPFIIRAINSHRSSSSSSEGNSDKPSFATITPTKDTAGYVPQSQKYDSAKQVYNFRGQYNGVDIIGTEQALPDIFRANKNKLKEQAQLIGATEHIDVVGGDAYISPVDGNTSQRAVYASSQLLVFVTYSGVMKGSEWVKFLQSLE